MIQPSFTVGIEEEYLLVDRETRDLVREIPPAMMSQCQARLHDQVTPEFLQCQIEVGTRVCGSIAEACADLVRLRATVAEIADRHGLAILAASTHPFAAWGAQKRTAKERSAPMRAPGPAEQPRPKRCARSSTC